MNLKVVLSLITMAAISAGAGIIVVESRHAALDMQFHIGTYGPFGLARDSQAKILYVRRAQRTTKTRPLVSNL